MRSADQEHQLQRPERRRANTRPNHNAAGATAPLLEPNTTAQWEDCLLRPCFGRLSTSQQQDQSKTPPNRHARVSVGLGHVNVTLCCV